MVIFRSYVSLEVVTPGHIGSPTEFTSASRQCREEQRSLEERQDEALKIPLLMIGY